MSGLRFGFISEIITTGLVRVRFPEDDFVTAPIPVCYPATAGDEYFFLPDENTQVACLMDEHAENGVVIGAIYNSNVKPSQGSKDKTYVKFKDGTVIVYDRNEHKYTATCEDTVFEWSRDGFTIKRGDETLKEIISDLIDQILAETHPTPTGPSGTPINATAYTAIKNRLPNLLKE